jgi:hypothetical protein
MVLGIVKKKKKKKNIYCHKIYHKSKNESQIPILLNIINYIFNNINKKFQNKIF